MSYMADDAFAYYRLERIDGAPLPAGFDYGDARCIIPDGDLVLRHDDMAGGDGIICIRLFGSVFGLPAIHQIFLEREAFDRLNAAHLTFPGGWRHRQGIPPHSVVRYIEDGLEVTALTADPSRQDARHMFGPHRWSFVASEQRLPDSDAGTGEPS